jgi:hypothetical protein
MRTARTIGLAVLAGLALGVLQLWGSTVTPPTGKAGAPAKDTAVGAPALPVDNSRVFVVVQATPNNKDSIGAAENIARSVGSTVLPSLGGLTSTVLRSPANAAKEATEAGVGSLVQITVLQSTSSTDRDYSNPRASGISLGSTLRVVAQCVVCVAGPKGSWRQVYSGKITMADAIDPGYEVLKQVGEIVVGALFPWRVVGVAPSADGAILTVSVKNTSPKPIKAVRVRAPALGGNRNVEEGYAISAGEAIPPGEEKKVEIKVDLKHDWRQARVWSLSYSDPFSGIH